MAFDPDAYLAATATLVPAGGSFDPDEYLRQTTPNPGGFDPDAYLAATDPQGLHNGDQNNEAADMLQTGLMAQEATLGPGSIVGGTFALNNLLAEKRSTETKQAEDILAEIQRPRKEREELVRQARETGKPVIFRDGKPVLGEKPVEAPLSTGDQVVQGIERGLGGAGLRVAEGASRLFGASETADALGKDVARMDSVLPEQTKAGRVGTGIGGAMAMLSGGGLPGMLGIAGTQAVASGYDAAYENATNVGADEETARAAAQRGAFKSAVRTVPELAAYWLLGAGAAKVVQPLVAAASPIAKVAAGGAAATVANIAGSTASRALHGEELFTPEGLATDVTLGFLAHGLQVGREAVRSEAQVREFLKSAPTESLQVAAADPAFRKSSPYSPKLIDEELASRGVTTPTATEPAPQARPPAQEAPRPQAEPANYDALLENWTKGAAEVFIENHGEVLDRNQAAAVAEKAGQRDIVELTASATPVIEVTSMDAATKRFETAEPFSVGPGAANSAEFPPQRVTSIKNATVDKQRAERGELPLMEPARKAMGVSWDQAMEKIDQNPNYASDLIDRVRNGSKTDISEVDQSAMLHEQIRIRAERDMEADRAADKYATSEERLQASERFKALEDRINEIDQATQMAGTIAGRALQIRQRMMNDDYTPAAMERRARVEKGAPLTAEETAKIKEQSDKIKDLEAKIAERAEQSDEVARLRSVEEAFKKLKEESSSPVSTGIAPRVFALAESIVARLDKSADAARARIRERLKNANAAIDPTVIYDVAVIGASKLGRASLDFAKWSSEMTADLGEWVKPHLQEAWDKTNEIWTKEEKRLSAGDRTEVRKVRAKNEDAATKQKNISESIKERLANGDKLSDLGSFVRSMAKEFMRVGVSTRDGLIDAVHGELKKIQPEITRREAMDAISGYGDFRALDKGAVETTLRDLKGQMQQLAKIEDMTAKKAPAKTGMERRVKSDEERRLEKQVNELKKRGGFRVTDPETQLKTAMDAIKTRLQNEIRDLDHAVATGERIANKKGTPEYDAEAKALLAERDAKKVAYDEAFPKEPLTEAQQIERAGRALDRSIASLEADLKNGKLYADKGRRLTSPELEAKRAQLDALRSERDNLRGVDTAAAESAREKALEKRIAELKERVAKDDTEAAPKTPTVDTQRVTELKAERDALSKSLADMRKTKNPPKSEEVRRVEQLDKRISELEAKIAAGDTSAKIGKPTVDTKEVAARKAQLQLLNDQLADMRRGPKKSAEEIALQSFKARTLSRIAELKERIAKNDFAPKAKRELVPDKEALDLKAKAAKLKQEYDQQLRKYEWERRSKLEKVMSAGLEILNSVRGVILGSDIGVLTRQGLFAWSRPVTALRATAQAFKSAFSPESMGRWEAEIRDREINGKSAAQERRRAGLRITDTLDHPEELVVTRLLSRIPDIEVAGKKIRLSEVGRTLERFQTTFINSVRAELFDAAVKQGFTPEELQLRANFINSATGSGNLKYVPKAMSAIFTSPRYEASRWEMLAQPARNIVSLATSGARGKLNKAALANLQDMGATVAGIYGIFQLAQASGYSVNWNPNSSDFLKMRKGNEVWDVSAGLAPRIRDVMRMFVAITHPSYSDNVGKVVLQTLMRAINPAIKTPLEQGSVALQRSRGDAKPILPFSGFKSDEEREGWITLAPLIVQSAKEAIKEDPSGAVFSILREFVGTSVSRYPEKK